MFKVFLSDEVLFLIDNFIDSYRNKFLKRFIDTWIFNENLIRNNYIEISKELRNNIYDEIHLKLEQEKILWAIIKENEKSVFIRIWNYKILVFYRENLDNNIRFVDKVEFYKK